MPADSTEQQTKKRHGDGDSNDRRPQRHFTKKHPLSIWCNLIKAAPHRGRGVASDRSAVSFTFVLVSNAEKHKSCTFLKDDHKEEIMKAILTVVCAGMLAAVVRSAPSEDTVDVLPDYGVPKRPMYVLLLQFLSSREPTKKKGRSR